MKLILSIVLVVGFASIKANEQVIHYAENLLQAIKCIDFPNVENLLNNANKSLLSETQKNYIKQTAKELKPKEYLFIPKDVYLAYFVGFLPLLFVLGYSLALKHYYIATYGLLIGFGSFGIFAFKRIDKSIYNLLNEQRYCRQINELIQKEL